MIAQLLVLALAAQTPQATELGSFLFQLGPLHEPAAAAIADDGTLAIVEAAANRVRLYDARGEQLASWGQRGREPGMLLDPRGIAFAPDGELWISDSGNHRVQAFTREGVLTRSFGGFGAEPGRFNDPRGLWVDGERVWVADARNDRVQVLDRSGKPLAVIGARGAAPGEFMLPLDVTLDGDGDLYVTDCDRHRVQQFDGEGKLVRAWGEFGPFPGQFAAPTAVDFAAGRLFVVDRDDHRTQVFDGRGELAYEWGLHALLPREGSGKVHYPDGIAVARDGSLALLCESFEDRAQAFGPREPLAPEDRPPPPERVTAAHFGPGIAAAENLMAVLEPEASALLLYRLELPEPIQITKAGVHGTGAGQMLRPHDAAIALDASGRREVFVSDPANLRLSSFAIAGAIDGEPRYDPYLLRFARSLDFAKLHRAGQDLGATWPIEPTGLALAPDGALWIADPRNRAVWRMSRALELERRLGDANSFLRPTDVAVSSVDGRVYVVDELAAQVLAFDAQGRALGPVAGASGQLVRPFGAAVASDGTLFVSDSFEDTVLVFDGDGKLLRRLGGPGMGRNEFEKPKGLALDGAGRLCVLDWGNHRGQVLSREGESLGSFGSRLFTRAFRGGR